MSRYGSLKGFTRYSKSYASEISNAEASNFLVDASTEIEGIISPRYVTPVTGTPPLVALLCNKLAAYRALDALLGDIQPNASEANTRKLNETLEQIGKIGTGDIELRSSGGSIIAIRAGGGMAYGMAMSKSLEDGTRTEGTPIEDWAMD